MNENPPPSQNLIDGIDANDSSRSELIDAIEILKEEIKRLNLKIDEQEKILEQEKSIVKEEFEKTDDIEILKEMIISQRKTLSENDEEIESLKEKSRLLDEYKKENEQLKAYKSQILDSKSTIDKLNNELEMHKTNEENAKELILKLTEEKNEYEANEKEALQFIEDLSEKKEKYKSKVVVLEKKLKDIDNASIADKSHLINEYESDKEDLIVQNVNYVNNINELQNHIENLNKTEKIYEQKIKKLEDKLEYVKISAIEEVSEFDDEREKLVNEYENKIKHLETKIENIETSFIKIKTTLETENIKYKKRIIDLQNLIQKHIKTGDQKKIGSIANVEFEDEIGVEIKNKMAPETEVKKKSKLNVEKATSIVKEKDQNEGVFYSESTSSVVENISQNHEVSTPKDEITKIEPIIDSVRKCPKCGNQKKSLIREELDKTNIILAYPRMYGKKYVCGAFGCGCNWRIKNKKIEIL